jgi:hypothetical protein
MLIRKSFAALLISGAFFFAGCDKPQVEPAYIVPETYNFENVDFSGQTGRLNQLSEMSTYMKTSRVVGVKVTEEKLLEYFTNPNGNIGGTDKKLEDKIYQPHKAQFLEYFQKLEEISSTTEAGAVGKAGVDGGYLFDENGVEIEQLIEKGLMGAVFYYQATSVYLSPEKINVDNVSVTPGKGTAMEHHFDEAFGYLGLPVDFKTNKTGLRFHGKYSNDRNEKIGTADKKFDAFLLGRAAISNKDLAKRDEAIVTIKENWELAVAATAISYINKGIANMNARPTRNHNLSEAIAFIMALRYNIDKKISNDQINQALENIGTNLDNAELLKLRAARDLISNVYGLNNVKDQL